jgi:hypothetical protein
MLNFMEAVARQEGFLKKGTRPQRNNNPGDIEWGKFAQAHGATGGDPRFAIFPTPEAGYSAMRALLRAAYIGLTVQAALNKWAPPVENDVSSYLTNVCQWSGLRPETVLTEENIG